ncbi:hypothetical protein HanRHA438_Chr12g0560721 [Helianthus annuus]|nr:hypothetical protein HanRHA438_Chr12g0560721 [Helianthus annuus]
MFSFSLLLIDLDPLPLKLLKRMQRVVNNNFSTPKNQSFVFTRIGFTIQNRVTAQLVVCLVTTIMNFIYLERKRTKKSHKGVGTHILIHNILVFYSLKKLN